MDRALQAGNYDWAVNILRFHIFVSFRLLLLLLAKSLRDRRQRTDLNRAVRVGYSYEYTLAMSSF